MKKNWALRIFNRFGWQITGELPSSPKRMITIAPHTSNWDFLVCLMVKLSLRIKVRYIIKQSWRIPVVGWFLGSLGAVFVDRKKKNDLVSEMVDKFAENEHFSLVITPEGTRSKVKRWRLGFYHIAKEARVPIVMLGLDYANKTVSLSEPLMPSGDIRHDLGVVFTHYQSIQGCYPKPIPFDQLDEL